MEEASTHPQRSLILRALNGADVEPDLSIREARVGDRYLLCSDGLSDVVCRTPSLEALQVPDPHASADRLVELALRGGGPDNVTCIVADVIDVPYGDDAPVLDGAAGTATGSSASRARPARRPGPPPSTTGRNRPTRPAPSRTGRAGAGCGSPSPCCSCWPSSVSGRTGCGGGPRRSTSSAPTASRSRSSAASTPRSVRCTSTR